MTKLLSRLSALLSMFVAGVGSILGILWEGGFWDKSKGSEKAARQNLGVNLGREKNQERGIQELSNWEAEQTPASLSYPKYASMEKDKAHRESKPGSGDLHISATPVQAGLADSDTPQKKTCNNH